MRLSEARLTIVGLGLIGGSMAGGLRGRCAELVGVDADAETLELARNVGLVDRLEADIGRGLQSCDLAVLAVPVGEIISILTRMGGSLPAPKYVLDVGSTKAEIVAGMQALPSKIDPLGGHPLCGKETSGLSAAQPDLFRDRTFVITPLERTSDKMRRLAHELVDVLGAHTLVMQAEEHDRLLAATSHLPYLLAVTLVGRVAELARTDSGIWELTASGFRDSTRLAGSDVRMMMDILSTNRAEIRSAIRAARDILDHYETNLQAGDLAAVETRLRDARRHWLGLEARRAAQSGEGA